MKILLPNPDEHSIDDFFEQFELSLYHAKKSWQKIKANYTPAELDGDDGPMISFRIQKLWDDYNDYGYKVVDNRDDQKIAIEINTE